MVAYEMRRRQMCPEGVHALGEASLLKVFLCVPPEHRRKLPLVCKKWSRACSSNELWCQVQVSLCSKFLHQVDQVALYRWFLAREGVVQQLEFEINSVECWIVIYGVLGIVGRHLQHLRVYGNSDGCYEPGGRAAWMALASSLVSLELENAADWTIGVSHFPTDLTHLELSYCGEEGLPTVPDHLGQLRLLASLSLQGSQLNDHISLRRLQACSLLQRLNLSDCCLEEVPPCLALLPRLTSLTLNSNPGLGGEDNVGRVVVLGELTSLQHLEMRECGLTCLPGSVAGLTSLRTLLLGLNDLSTLPFLPRGPYLSRLAMLGLSDCFGEDGCGVTLRAVAAELEGAVGLEVLRINRNDALGLTARGLRTLLAGKPRLQRLDFSQEMVAPGLDLAALRAQFPGVSFRPVD